MNRKTRIVPAVVFTIACTGVAVPTILAACSSGETHTQPDVCVARDMSIPHTPPDVCIADFSHFDFAEPDMQPDLQPDLLPDMPGDGNAVG